ncbi:hypothetical protein KM043_001862 [Ampulex compressa]|nr:hypothetical protein KM043_001862 [Ampulex compressa]
MSENENDSHCSLRYVTPPGRIIILISASALLYRLSFTEEASEKTLVDGCRYTGASTARKKARSLERNTRKWASGVAGETELFRAFCTGRICIPPPAVEAFASAN